MSDLIRNPNSCFLHVKAQLIFLQPRRISAVSIAERVANERAEALGISCGYSVRFETVMPRPYGAIMYCTVGKLFFYN